MLWSTTSIGKWFSARRINLKNESSASSKTFAGRITHPLTCLIAGITANSYKVSETTKVQRVLCEDFLMTDTQVELSQDMSESNQSQVRVKPCQLGSQVKSIKLGISQFRVNVYCWVKIKSVEQESSRVKSMSDSSQSSRFKSSSQTIRLESSQSQLKLKSTHVGVNSNQSQLMLESTKLSLHGVNFQAQGPSPSWFLVMFYCVSSGAL